MTSRALVAGGRQLALPQFFPAVSSVKDDRPLVEYVDFLTAVDQPTALVSAYDVGGQSAERRGYVARTLRQWMERGNVLLMDSGRYEAFWLADSAWALKQYVAAVAEISPTFVLSLDAPTGLPDVEGQVAEAERWWAAAQDALPDTTVLPVLHGTPRTLPAAVSEVARHIQPPMIAIPERELGNGIAARAGTVYEIRSAIDAVAPATVLHLLGTGNPLSVLIYAAAGADTFDGLEWCRTIVDHETARLYHFHQFDFFASQTSLPTGDSFRGRGLSHNLLFWHRWMERLRTEPLTDLIGAYVPQAGRVALVSRLPEIYR